MIFGNLEIFCWHEVSILILRNLKCYALTLDRNLIFGHNSITKFEGLNLSHFEYWGLRHKMTIISQDWVWGRDTIYISIRIYDILVIIEIYVWGFKHSFALNQDALSSFHDFNRIDSEFYWIVILIWINNLFLKRKNYFLFCFYSFSTRIYNILVIIGFYVYRF